MNLSRSSMIFRATLLTTAMLCIAPASAQAQATAMERLAAAIGDALKAATGKDVRRQRGVAEQVFAQPVMPAQLTPEAELKERNVRLKAYSAVAADWLDDRVKLQPAQQQKLQKIIQARIATSQVAARKPQDNNQRGNQGFSDYFAINFTDTKGAALDLNFLRKKKLLAEVALTPEQQSELDKFTIERKVFHDSANVGHILNQLDSELYFTADQRASMADIVRLKVPLGAACYSMNPMNYYFQQTPIAAVITGEKQLKCLGVAQKLRAADLAGTSRDVNAEQYVSFQSNEGIDLWQDKLKEAIQAQRKRMMRAVGVRVDFHRGQCEMPDVDARRLLVAGKGATDTLVAKWKTTASRQLKSYEEHAAMRGQGNFSFSIGAPDVQQIDGDSVWKHTIEQLLPAASDHLAHRNSVRMDATANFIVATLDRELWLSASQRDILFEAVRKELPSPDFQIQNSRYYLEVSLLMIPLFKLGKRDLAVLSDTQEIAFEAMKKPFQVQNSYVVVQMKNGGQMHLQIPK